LNVDSFYIIISPHHCKSTVLPHNGSISSHGHLGVTSFSLINLEWKGMPTEVFGLGPEGGTCIPWLGLVMLL